MQQIPTESPQISMTRSSSVASPLLYSASTDGQVHVWDLETLGCAHTFFEHGHPVMNDLLAIEGMSQVAGACLDGKIYMIDLHLHRVAKTLSGHKKAVSMLRYSSENGYLISAGLDHCVQVWNPHVEQKIGSLLGHRDQLIGMEVVPNSPQVITADESGVVKIWDLRKFAAVQTIAKELYVKDRSIPRTLTRSMTSMCYIASKKRIAMANSTIFFIDQSPKVSSKGSDERAIEADATCNEEGEADESKKPIAVFYSPPTRCFMTFTCWEIKCWDANSGQLVRTSSPIIGSEMTCACMVDDHFSCFVGAENGIVARLMLPNGSVVVQKRVHPVEITAIQWIKEKKQVVSSAVNGNILITRYDTLDVVFKLNHWRGVQSASNAFFHGPTLDDGFGELLESKYSVPLSLRSFFYGNEIERLMRVFGQADPSRGGSISLSTLPLVLEQAFPTTFTNHNASGAKRSSGDAACDRSGYEKEEMITFASLLQILKDSLTALQDGKITKSEWSISSVSSLDVHAQAFSLVSGSSSDGTFCVWNIKNGAVVAQGNVGSCNQQQGPSSSSISRIAFLYPYPYFMCAEEGSSYLTFWSTIALPPLLPHSYQCFLRFPHLQAVQSESTAEKTGMTNATFFITETESPSDCDPSDQEAAANTSRGAAVLAVEWFCGGGEKELLVCVGDEHGNCSRFSFPPACWIMLVLTPVLLCTGFITIYDLELVFNRMETIKQESSALGLQTNDGTSKTPDCEDISPRLVKKLHQWHAHRSTAIRKLEIVRSNELRSIKTLIISVTENGVVTFWSMEGQLVGRLNERSSLSRNCPSTSVPATWTLRVDTTRARSNDQEQATQLLQKMELRIHRAQDDQVAEKRIVKQNARRNTVGDTPIKQSPRATSRMLSISSIRSPSVKFQ